MGKGLIIKDPVLDVVWGTVPKRICHPLRNTLWVRGWENDERLELAIKINKYIYNKKQYKMKIAVPTTQNNQIDNHFGHCEFYTIFNISDDNQIIAETIVESPQGCGCKSNIAYDLAGMGVKVMLAGGIGDGAINKLASQRIEVIRNCKGEVTELVEEYLKGNLKDGGASCAAHDHNDCK